MRPPKKKRVGFEPPDAVKDEGIVDTIGGTDGEGIGVDEDWGRTVPDELDYGRTFEPEPGDDDQPI